MRHHVGGFRRRLVGDPSDSRARKHRHIAAPERKANLGRQAAAVSAVFGDRERGANSAVDSDSGMGAAWGNPGTPQR